VATLDEALQAQLQESWQLLARQQEDLDLLIEQTRLELERETASYERVRVKIEALYQDLHAYSPERLRELLEAVNVREVRLANLRAEFEGLEYKRSVLADEARSLARFGALLNGDVSIPSPVRRDRPVPGGTSDVGALLLAQETERERLAQRLHDDVVQPLHQIVLQIELLKQLIKTDPARAVAEMQAIPPFATQTLRDARRAIFELRPMSLDDLGLAPTLERYAQVRREQDGLVVHLHTEGRPREISPPIATAIFRIVEAALDNVLRHSEVREATITLNFTERELIVIVSDAGKGCHLRLVQATVHGGTGLLGMRERARQIGAALHLDSAPGRGMTVRLSVPLLSLMAVGAGMRRRTPNES
jgi:signal transduction histidine kinase